MSGISVETGYSSILRSNIDQNAISSYLLDVKPTIFTLSGDGTKLFYANPNDSNTPYMLDFNTGVSSKLTSDEDVRRIVANYDGTKIAYFYNQSNAYLAYYNFDLVNKRQYITNFAGQNQFAITDDGTLIYYEQNGTSQIHLYTPDGNDTVIASTTAAYLLES